MIWKRILAWFTAGDRYDPPAKDSPREESLEFPEVLEIAPDALLNQSEQDGWLILDCREPIEWAQGRIPGSLHIPMNEIPGRMGELQRDQEILVVCAHGVRSLMVAGFLKRNGFSAASLRGGLAWWAQLGGELQIGPPHRNTQ